MVTLLWPLALLLLPLPLFVGRLPPERSGPPAPALPPRLAEGLAGEGVGKAGRERLRIALASLAWLCLVAALSRPAVATGNEIRPMSGRAIVLAIDLSGSMERKDFAFDGQPVDRLAAVKTVAADFLEKRTGDRVGLVLFGEEAFAASPLTFDLAAIGGKLDSAAIGMAGRTTAVGAAIGTAVAMLRNDPARERAVVLLSDGANNAGPIEPEDAAALAADYGIRVHTIGLGSQAQPGASVDPSADLDQASLEAIAEMSGGRAFRARTTAELGAVYDEIDGLEGAETDAPPIVPRVEIGIAFAAIFVLASAGFSLAGGWRRA